MEPVRGSGLKIDLDANSNLTFYDLYSEEERTFSVVYTRATDVLFNGWLSPEGIYESLVSDKWIISLDCTDGLGFLANLSYVEEATGLTFVGKQSLLEIIVNCLKRTKTPQNILTSVKIYYDGLNQSLNPFSNIYFNSDRFIKDDKGDTKMNCEEVLKSVLEPFGLVITAYKGEWLIYSPNSLVESSSQIFFQYDSDGVALSNTSRTIDFAFDLGSQIDSYYPHHVNGNQQKTIKSAIGAFRINYKYGLVKSFFTNLFLKNFNGVVDEWTINDSTKLTFPSNNMGLILESLPFSTGFPPVITQPTKIITLDSVSFIAGNQITFNIEYYVLEEIFNPSKINIHFKVVLTDGNSFYYLKNNSEWSNNSDTNSISGSNAKSVFSINSLPLPIDGDIYIELYTPIITINATYHTLVTKCDYTPYDQTTVNLKGENHTFQRILKPSSKIKDTKEVFNGDNPSDIYVGTIYKADETTTTEIWTRQGAQEAKPLLQIMGEERMKMYSKPLQVYSGDVYGYFMPTTYSYNALSNVTSLELTEVLNTDIISDILYEVTFDYGNVVEPTIKG